MNTHSFQAAEKMILRGRVEEGSFTNCGWVLSTLLQEGYWEPIILAGLHLVLGKGMGICT